MKKFLCFLIIAVMAIPAGIMLSLDNAEAVPAFARQTQQPCFACHFQHIPKLGAMGRAFKLGGFTDTSRDPIGDNLVLDIAPFSIVFKSLFEKEDKENTSAIKTGAERGDWVIPDEVEGFFAGRINDKWGALLVLPFSDKAAADGSARAFVDGGKLIYSDEYAGVQFGGTMFFSGGGPFFAMELWNTGLQKGQRSWENRNATVASQKAGATTHEAMGFSLFAANEWGFAMVGPMVPKSRMGGGQTDIGDDFGIFYRAAFTPTYENWDFMLGVFGAGGNAKCDCNEDGVLEAYKTKYVGMDAQAQGEFMGASVEVTFNSILDTADSGTNLVPSNKNAEGYGGSIDVGFMEDMVGLKLAAMTYDDDSITDDDTYFNIGGWWNIYQDLRLMPEVSFQSNTDNQRGYDSKFIVTLFTAF